MAKWAQVRITAEQHERLTSLAAEMHEAHVLGRTVLPTEHAEHVPIHFVVEYLLNEVQARRERSRRPKRRMAGQA